jgi:hypothetical protein
MSTPTPLPPARRRRLLLLAALAVAAGCSKHDNPVGPGSNRAPEIRNVAINPRSVRLGGTASVSVEAVDPDGDRIFFRYQADAGTIVADPQQPSRATYTNNSPAGRVTARVTVFVTDDKNASSSFNTDVDLLGNQSPLVDVRAGRSSCHPECTVSVTATAQDVEGDVLEYEWSGCASGVGRTSECRVRHVGPATAIVTVRDSRGGVALGTATVSGVNLAPQVAREGGEIKPNPSRLNITPSDPDGDEYRCAWRGDCTCTGDFQSWNANCGIAGAAAACTMTAYCWDPWGGTGEARFRVQR